MARSGWLQQHRQALSRLAGAALTGALLLSLQTSPAREAAAGSADRAYGRVHSAATVNAAEGGADRSASAPNEADLMQARVEAATGMHVFSGQGFGYWGAAQLAKHGYLPAGARCANVRACDGPEAWFPSPRSGADGQPPAPSAPTPGRPDSRQEAIERAARTPVARLPIQPHITQEDLDRMRDAVEAGVVPATGINIPHPEDVVP